LRPAHWHRWEELLQHCHILVLQRPDADSEPPDALRNLLAARSVSDPLALKGPSGQIAFVWQTPLAVSATQIRQLLASGKSVRFLVPDAVWPTSMRTVCTVRRTERRASLRESTCIEAAEHMSKTSFI
jgi:nicotinic acid mononucleotide adenylyltransferase